MFEVASSTETCALGIENRADDERRAKLYCFLCGVAVLLPWNAYITAVDYFLERFTDTQVDRVFSVAYMACNIVVVSALQFSRISGLRRVIIGFTGYIISLVLVPIADALTGSVSESDGSSAANGNSAYWLVLLCGLLLAGICDGFCQPGVFSEAAALPLVCTEAVSAGVAASGVIVSLLRVATKAASASLRMSAFTYFVAAALYVSTCIPVVQALSRLSLYRTCKNASRINAAVNGVMPGGVSPVASDDIPLTDSIVSSADVRLAAATESQMSQHYSPVEATPDAKRPGATGVASHTGYGPPALKGGLAQHARHSSDRRGYRGDSNAFAVGSTHSYLSVSNESLGGAPSDHSGAPAPVMGAAFAAFDVAVPPSSLRHGVALPDADDGVRCGVSCTGLNALAGRAWASRRAEVLRRLALPASAVLVIYAITLAIFPGFLSEDLQDDALGSWYPVLLFLVYNTADFVFRWTAVSQRTLLPASLARLGFVPLFALCSHYGAPTWLVFALTAAFGASNGTLTTTAFAVASKIALPLGVAEDCGNVMVFSLMLGLVIGSLLSWLWLL